MKRLFSGLFFTCFILVVATAQPAKPISAVRPTAAQLAWHETNFYLFFHFGPNTFTNLEWGHGTETEDVFNPSALDCEQWCRIAKQAGAKGVVITAKHHDGFCLWPSLYSKHTVRESKWKNGHGDILRELSNACRNHGLKFGVYLSPWDRNHPKYGTDEYNDIYANTLKELLTGYGPLFEVWWDGANGEGPNGKKQVYDFHRFEKLVAQYQPGAVIFSDIGPGCRWAGNEEGTVDETNWCMLDTVGFGRGATGPPGATLQTGQENGAVWIPAECDVSIRPGWFYHPEEDVKVKTPDQLMNIYLHSVGHGSNLILNVPPDRNGRIHAQDSAALVDFGKKLSASFRENIAFGKPCYNQAGRRSMKGLTDGRFNTYNTIRSRGAAGRTIFMDLGGEQTFNSLELREYIAKGQSVRRFTVAIPGKDGWTEIARSTTIGSKKILVFPEVRAAQIRIILESGQVDPLISEVQVYKM
jgi:alpha-L-fucosidase